MPLRIFEQRYMTMAKGCLKDGAAFGVCLIRDGNEVGDPAVPAEVGTLARIAEWDMAQLGLLEIVARGEQHFRILSRRVQADGLVRASVEVLPNETDSAIPAACAPCVKLLEQVMEQHAAFFERPHRLDSSAWVSARLAEILPLPLPIKQQLLETDDARTRLEHLNGFLAKETAKGD